MGSKCIYYRIALGICQQQGLSETEHLLHLPDLQVEDIESQVAVRGVGAGNLEGGVATGKLVKEFLIKNNQCKKLITEQRSMVDKLNVVLPKLMVTYDWFSVRCHPGLPIHYLLRSRQSHLIQLHA